MSFTITCPTCGPRSYTEFRFGGELRRHGDDLWLRRNAAGIQTERWFHQAGCCRWLTVARDTTTNAFVEVEE
jgi:sarcosine oxidase, subunit delta